MSQESPVKMKQIIHLKKMYKKRALRVVIDSSKPNYFKTISNQQIIDEMQIDNPNSRLPKENLRTAVEVHISKPPLEEENDRVNAYNIVIDLEHGRYEVETPKLGERMSSNVLLQKLSDLNVSEDRLLENMAEYGIPKSANIITEPEASDYPIKDYEGHWSTKSKHGDEIRDTDPEDQCYAVKSNTEYYENINFEKADSVFDSIEERRNSVYSNQTSKKVQGSESKLESIRRKSRHSINSSDIDFYDLEFKESGKEELFSQANICCQESSISKLSGISVDSLSVPTRDIPKRFSKTSQKLTPDMDCTGKLTMKPNDSLYIHSQEPSISKLSDINSQASSISKLSDSLSVQNQEILIDSTEILNLAAQKKIEDTSWLDNKSRRLSSNSRSNDGTGSHASWRMVKALKQVVIASNRFSSKIR
jgi:hypothetical protein